MNSDPSLLLFFGGTAVGGPELFLLITLLTPNVCDFFPSQPILSLSGLQLGVLQFNSDTNEPESVQTL